MGCCIRNYCSSTVFKLFKCPARTYSVKLDASRVDSNNNQHIFRKTFTKTQLIDYMINSVIYNQDGIVVLDKPYGIGAFRESDIKNFRSNYKPRTFETLALKDVIDEIAKLLSYDILKIQKVPERYASGITILTGSEKAEKLLTTFIWRADSLKTPYTFLIVTSGSPCRNSNHRRYGLKFDSKTKHCHFVDDWSLKSQKKGEVFGLNVHHVVLSSSEFGSLVKVNVNTYKHNALRLYMVAQCLSPILGDDRYSSRIVKLGDTAVDLGPENPQSKRSLKLPLGILKALNLEENESDVVPVHMHLYSFPFIHKRMRECTDLLIRPPEWFVWSCRQLKLDIDSALSMKIKSLQ